MIKKRNQLITLIATPTMDLRGLNGVSTGAALLAAKLLDSGISGVKRNGFDDSSFKGFDFKVLNTTVIGSATPDGNLPIA